MLQVLQNQYGFDTLRDCRSEGQNRFLIACEFIRNRRKFLKTKNRCRF